MSHWVALRSLLSGFSFQLSAFQLLPKCGFEVALGGFARSFCILHSSFCLRLARHRRVLEWSLSGACR
jgi:hypothetical protein